MSRVVTAVGLLLLASGSAADDSRYGFVEADRIEYGFGPDRPAWDLQGWYGGDEHKLWWKLDGVAGDDDENELQLLYSRAVSPFFDLQFGVAINRADNQTGSAAVIGVQGLAPYGIEIDTAFFLTDHGDVLLAGEFERDFYLTQRIALQPRVEILADDGGVSETEAGVRLRYEVTRNFAPYIGVSWLHNNDADESDTSVLVGLRFWF